MKNAWNKRKTRLEHDNAIAGWAMSIMPEIRTDVNERMTGEHRNAIERVVLRLHSNSVQIRQGVWISGMIPRLSTSFGMNINLSIPKQICSTTQAGGIALMFALGSLIPGTRNILGPIHLSWDM